MDLNSNSFDTPSTSQPHMHHSLCNFCPHDDALHGNHDAFMIHEPEPMGPFQYTYLLNLCLTPNMDAYLAEAPFSDDVYALPIHLQRLLMEAKEEVVLERTRGQAETTHPALERLKRVRGFCWLRSDADVANLMSTLVELVADDDELERIVS
ncbi:hypothetical protein DM01DRAFT_1331685 [Hesseltinella vesiculosa]|uniref:Uncharacterized protein n=1 Tax=Hesseltinella vesiculosa TaxID=101127 RepID=A0A1X2GW11_9FUNG|nr:hypothetical protein DM01DRAFT_1331685 [Hesseltinella vesiculosa]